MIVPETLDNIAKVVATFADLNDEAMAALKSRWPSLRFTFCNDDDMPARMPPVLQGERFNLYLVSGSEHCLSLTVDPLQAIGVVVAGVDED
jgi:hypothetical protein